MLWRMRKLRENVIGPLQNRALRIVYNLDRRTNSIKKQTHPLDELIFCGLPHLSIEIYTDASFSQKLLIDEEDAASKTNYKFHLKAKTFQI